MKTNAVLNKQTIPIVFAIDKKFLPPAYIAIKSLLDFAKKDTYYEIIILYLGKVDSKVEELSKLVNTPHAIRVIDIQSYSMFAPVTFRIWPAIVYARLYLASWLPEYDKVIYSDVDVLFQGDLTDIYNESIEEYDWGG